ncbi:MAG: ATP-binding cassette domain-containing protein [bacterium]
MSSAPRAVPQVPPLGPVRAAGEDAVRFQAVTKSFAGRDAVRDLDLVVPRGAIYGLLGPNGAGKTTSIRMLMGILGPDAGSIAVLGEPTAAVKDRIGYLPEERGLYLGMKVIDNLVFFGTVRGLARPDARRRGEQWLGRLGLGEAAPRKLQELSKGNQQKVQFAATVLHGPELVVLDEPFSGLDPLNQDLLRRTMLDLAAAGTTIILSTHAMDEVERICSHLTLLDGGRTLAQGELDEVKARWGEDTLRMDAAGDPHAIERHPWVRECRTMGRTLEVRLEAGRDPSEFLAQVSAAARVRRFEIRTPSLHSIFVRLVGDARGNGAEGPDDPVALDARPATPGRAS